MRASSGAGKMWCPACGGKTTRGTARYCADCGKLLAEDYEPLDALRASYRLQRRPLEIETVMQKNTPLFEGETSSTAQTAWACVVYSMVPYLGILFIPFAFAVSGVGYFTITRNVARNRRITGLCFGLSFLILVVQIGLWWLLYIIPKISQGGPIAN